MSDAMRVDVVASRAEQGDGGAGFSVKIQAPALEINIWASSTEWERLSDMPQADWLQRRSVRLGESAGASVFWCLDESELTIMVGQDDETWDVAVTVPRDVLSAIADALIEAGLR
ncbi:MAG: hypothetical protein AB7N76_24255 [Planctomycetota bacterium]